MTRDVTPACPMDSAEPLLDFPGTSTPYIDYQCLDVLLTLQQPRTAAAAEPVFYTLGQVKELLFKILHEELCRARDLLPRDLRQAVWTLRRTRKLQDLLTASWDVLSTLTPPEFNAFREALGQASGFQSYTYRMLEYVLGNKSVPMARPHRHVPRVHESVQQALRSPSVYDAALQALAMNDVPIPPAVLDRNWAVPYCPHPEVERAWCEVYRSHGPGDPLFDLAEALIDIAEGASRWRALHLLTVERVIGSKPGTGGTAGLSWLRSACEHRFFPELWTCRSLL